MEDPTTIALNLTFFGTLGIAFIMMVGLGVVVVLTLILAGIGRLLSLILLALIGIFPKRDTVEIVHLPEQPHRSPNTLEGSTPELIGAKGLAEGAVPAEESQPLAARAGDAFSRWTGQAGAWFESQWSALRGFRWKSAAAGRKLPKPGEVGAAVSAGVEAGVDSQAKHHPFVVAAKHQPHAMSPKWAAAVAAADARAEEREKAAAPPEIVVTVRDLPPAEAPAEAVEKVAPLVESAVDPHGPRRKLPASSTAAAAQNGVVRPFGEHQGA